MEMPLPGVITVVKEINEPRLPSLKGMMRAKKAEVPMWTADDLGLDKNKIGLAGSPTQVISIFSPERIHKSEILQGSIEEQAKQLVEKLKETKVV
jgi:electron transfer flavoprotein beta subunit